jgi:hypothetical protein
MKNTYKNQILSLTIFLLVLLALGLASATEPMAYERPIEPIAPAEGCGYMVLSTRALMDLESDNPGAMVNGHYLIMSSVDLEALRQYIEELEKYNRNANAIINHYESEFKKPIFKGKIKPIMPKR